MVASSSSKVSWRPAAQRVAVQQDPVGGVADRRLAGGLDVVGLDASRRRSSRRRRGRRRPRRPTWRRTCGTGCGRGRSAPGRRGGWRRAAPRPTPGRPSGRRGRPGCSRRARRRTPSRPRRDAQPRPDVRGRQGRTATASEAGQRTGAGARSPARRHRRRRLVGGHVVEAGLLAVGPADDDSVDLGRRRRGRSGPAGPPRTGSCCRRATSRVSVRPSGSATVTTAPGRERRRASTSSQWPLAAAVLAAGPAGRRSWSTATSRSPSLSKSAAALPGPAADRRRPGRRSPRRRVEPPGSPCAVRLTRACDRLGVGRRGRSTGMAPLTSTRSRSVSRSRSAHDTPQPVDAAQVGPELAGARRRTTGRPASDSWPWNTPWTWPRALVTNRSRRPSPS